MPKVSRLTAADASDGVLSNMHPRLNNDDTADIILLPDDTTEGRGNFLVTDEQGNPDGFTLGQPPKKVSSNIFGGTSPDKVTKQNTVPIPVHDTSYLVNGPLVTGDEPPEQLIVSGASLPKPPPPTVQKVPAEVAGYPASTEARPYWITYTYNRNNKISQLAPAVKCPPLAQGQCFRVTLPDKIPVGAAHIDIWLTMPGQSTPSAPGQFRKQKTYPFSAYGGHEVDLVGPFVYSTERPTGTNLAPPAPPLTWRVRERAPLRIGTYRSAMTLASELGESLPSAVTAPITVAGEYYLDDQGVPEAGYGKIVIERPATLPQGASGWYPYILVGNQWHRVFEVATGHGLTKPFPFNYRQVITKGWTGSEKYAGNNTPLLSSHDLPTEDTSGIPDPDSPLEEPTIFGAARPAPGKYYFRQTDVDENGEESPLSDASQVDLGQDEVMRVVLSNRINQLPNATFVEKGADGLPLGYTALNASEAPDNVSVDSGVLTVKTPDATSGATVEIYTDVMSVNPTQQWNLGATLDVQQPETGEISGAFEVVLREVNASAVQTDTVIKSVNQAGEVRFLEQISPPGYSTYSFQADTQVVQIIYRFTGATKNMRVGISRQVFNDLAYSFRRRDQIFAIPETTANPSGSVAVENAPPTEGSQEAPDLPSSAGTVLEALDFSSLPGGAWAQDATGATLTTSGGKLIMEKTATGTGRASLSKSFAPPQGLATRNAHGVALNGLTFPVIPSNGAITLAELRRPSDSSRLAWIDLDGRREEAKLLIESSPLSSGNVTTTLDEGGATQRNTSVVAVKESASLTINDFASSDGEVSVVLNGNAYSIPVTKGRVGQREVVTVEITQGAATSGLLAVYLGSPDPTQLFSTVHAQVYAGDSPETIAARLRAYPVNNSSWASDYWLISGTGRTIVFTTKAAISTPGGHAFYPIHTKAQARVTTNQKGIEAASQDTPVSIAGKIRGTAFDGYSTAGDGPTIEIEALEPGERLDPSYSANSTGAGGSMVVTAQGAQDTPEEVATKIAATYSGNTFFTVTRNGALLTILSTSSGSKIDAKFSGGTTGTQGTMHTSIQGSTDIVGYAQDRFGVTRQRHIIEDVTISTIANVSLSVSGAGYPPAGDSKAVVQMWGSTGSSAATKTFRGVFEGIDLGDYPAGVISLGVSNETSTSTWRVECEEAKVTDRGETYLRYHDYAGSLLNQVHGFFPPNQIPRDDLYLQDYRQAVLPNTEYTASIFARYNGRPGQPFYLYGVTPDFEEIPIGDLLTGTFAGGALASQSAWAETAPLTFTTPENCHELRLVSKGMGPGEIVCQELCVSLGTEVKRTNLYATSGSYTGVLDISTPNKPDFFVLSIGRERKVFAMDVAVPSEAGAGVVTTYRSADYKEGPFGLSYSDPDEVEQKDFLRVDVSASGNGLVTPQIRAGFPHAEYVLMANLNPISTFLKSDRTEFDGGAVLANLQESSEPPEVVYQRLPGGRWLRTATYPPVGQLPAFELQVFTPEARRYIEDRSGMVDFSVETHGKILMIRTSSPIRFERQIRDIWRTESGLSPDSVSEGEAYQNLYVAKVSDAWVLSVEDMP